MADITAGLPTLSPEEAQAQQDRARLAALGGTVGRGLMDAGTLLPRAIVGLGNQLIRIPNAFGADIPAQRLPTDTPGALPTFSAAPYSTAATNTGGATGSFGPPLPAMTAPAPAAPAPAPAPPAPAPKPPTTGRTGSAGMPAGAPAPLVPGVTGFYMNNTLVPYGQLQATRGGEYVGPAEGAPASGGGGGGGGSRVSMANLPGGGAMADGRFVDPRDALEYGFRLQSRYRDESIEKILDAAGPGSALGFRAKVSALASAFGANNFGADSVGGANSLNQAVAHIAGAQVGAGATVTAAQLGAGAQAAHTTELGREFDATPRPIGQTAFTDPATGLTTQRTAYGMPASATPLTPIDASIPKAKPVPGKIYKDRSGNQATYNADGTYTPVK